MSDKMDKMAVQFCADMEKFHVLAVPLRTNGSEMDEKNGEMEEHCFRQACRPGGRTGYNWKEYAAAYSGIWEYGVAQRDFDGACAGGR